MLHFYYTSITHRIYTSRSQVVLFFVLKVYGSIS